MHHFPGPNVLNSVEEIPRGILYVSVCICMYLFVFVSVCICMYLYVSVCICMYLYVSVCICMCSCLFNCFQRETNVVGTKRGCVVSGKIFEKSASSGKRLENPGKTLERLGTCITQSWISEHHKACIYFVLGNLW